MDNGVMIRTEALFAAKQGVSMDAPLEHLKACHRRIEERLSVMERAAWAMVEQREAAVEAFESAFGFMDTSGALHTADEEESLFPRLMGRLEQGEKSYVAGLEHDHTEAHRLYEELKGAVRGGGEVKQVRGLVARLVGLYRRHIESEDEVLQAMAAERLGAAELAEIGAEMRARRA